METNCPNCGAPVSGYVCKYCGSVLDRHAEAEVQMLKAEIEEIALTKAMLDVSDRVIASISKWPGAAY